MPETTAVPQEHSRATYAAPVKLAALTPLSASNPCVPAEFAGSFSRECERLWWPQTHGHTPHHVVSVTMWSVQSSRRPQSRNAARKRALACASQTNKLSRAVPRLTTKLAPSGKRRAVLVETKLTFRFGGA